jgi:tetratricopeptide (TPR) repeat protein/transcriptional regulator with XRE-family HTH domain
MKQALRANLIAARKDHQWTQQEVANRLGTIRMNVSRWEQGVTTPGPYFRARLCALYGKSAQELDLLREQVPEQAQHALAHVSSPSVQEQQVSLWTVLHPRNPHFTGRADLLEQLEQHFSMQEPGATRRAALTQTQAIKGLGGIGKTQIAVEYAYRARTKGLYTHILWINAASSETLLTSFVALAALLPAFAARDEQDQHRLLLAIRRWLEQCPQNWLLICDNADDLSLVQNVLPQQGNGCVLLTTRASAVGSLATSLDVETMGLVEGTRLLLHRAQRLQADDEETNEAMNIVIALDGFPLALDQAGAYIEETGCSFGEYLALYQSHRKALLARRGRQATDYPAAVATTWSLSLQKVAEANPAAAELLQLCAFLAPDRIPEELLKHGAPYWPRFLQQAVADPFTSNQMLEALFDFSLVKRLARDHQLSIHRLVQVVQVDAMERGEQRQWAERVVQATATLFPATVEIATWGQCQRYLSQAQVCSTLIQEYTLASVEAAMLLHRAAAYLHAHALYEQARPLHEQAIGIGEKVLPLDHPQFASLLQGLARLFHVQSKYEQAIDLYQRVLQIREQALGPAHPDVAETLDGLAVIYLKQGKYRQARTLLWRVLRICKQTLGANHPDVARSYNSMATLYQEQGKYKQAILFLQRAIYVWEQAQGTDCSNVARPLSNLGLCYAEQGKYALAESFYQRAFHIYEKTLGPEHPELAYTIQRLAIISYQQGKYIQAEQLIRRAISIRTQTLGPDHADIAEPLNVLAAILKAQGQYAQAEELFLRSLHIWKQTLGPEHPYLARPLNNLANLYILQGKYAQAEPLYQRALQIRERGQGADHPHLAHPLNGLANCAREKGDYAQAESLYQRALSLREKHLEYHPDTAETLYDFAILREAQGQFQEAILLYQRALTIRERVLGPAHVQTMETRAKYAQLVRDTSRDIPAWPEHMLKN